MEFQHYIAIGFVAAWLTAFYAVIDAFVRVQ